MTTPFPPGAANADPAAHRELLALKRWRDLAVQQRRVGLGAIKDTDLTRIVMSGRKDVRQVRQMLPSSARHLAEEMIDVQVQSNQAAQQPPGPTGRPGSGQPAAGQPGAGQPGAGQPGGGQVGAPTQQYAPPPQYPPPGPQQQPVGRQPPGGPGHGDQQQPAAQQGRFQQPGPQQPGPQQTGSPQGAPFAGPPLSGSPYQQAPTTGYGGVGDPRRPAPYGQQSAQPPQQAADGSFTAARTGQGHAAPPSASGPAPTGRSSAPASAPGPQQPGPSGDPTRQGGQGPERPGQTPDRTRARPEAHRPSPGTFTVPDAPVRPTERSGPSEQDLEHLRTQVAPRFAATRRIGQLPGGPEKLKVTEVASGLRLRWPADPDAGRIVAYRVVTGDDFPPHSPEAGQLVDITDALTTVDTRPAITARRFFCVYSYTAETVLETMESQPRLIATADLVFGLQDPQLEEDEGRVIGRWSYLPGTDRVHVFRVPLERAHLAAPGDEQYRINGDETNLTGFVDKTATRGRRYRYDFAVESRIDDQARQSEIVSVECSVSASLTRVTDLQVVRHVGESSGGEQAVSFDLSWTAPSAGEVQIYRTEEGPAPGATNQAHRVDALPQMSLKPADLQKLPVERLPDGRQGMRDVPAKLGWSRVHLTPVTVLDGMARLGETVTQLIVGRPSVPEVVERCDHQVLKFGWPSGAAKVVVVPRPLGEDPTVPTPGPGYAEITREDYDKLGGLQFRTPLWPQGCAVHLAGVAFEGGDGGFGPPVVADYPGLTRLRYDLEWRQRFFKLDRLVVKLSAERDLSQPPPFMLVHRPERLPLFPLDGTALELSLDVAGGGQASRYLRPDRLGREWTAIGWSANVRGMTGYVRLFVDPAAGRYALLDPSAQLLQLPNP